MKFGEHDKVMVAWAEPARGPGWANQPIWVLVRSQLDGGLRIECVQPGEQSREMLLLYGVSAAVTRDMTDWTRLHLTKKRRRKA